MTGVPRFMSPAISNKKKSDLHQLKLTTKKDDYVGCLREMRVFCKGGPSGKARLHRVLPSLFMHYQITHSDGTQAALIRHAGLTPVDGVACTSFEWPPLPRFGST